MNARRALVVANDDYADGGLQQLRAPARDAEALTGVLADPAVGGFAVTVVRNGTVQQLRETVEEFFGRAGREDELLVHFSCHGLKDETNDLYLAAADTRPALLASTGLPAEFVARRMRSSRARSVALFLDCCYGGAVERGMLARAGPDVHVLDAMKQEHLAVGAGRVVITASSAVEYAFENGDLAAGGQMSPSVFTGALVDGIATGAADADGDGMIGISELFAYAEQQVLLRNPNQTPHMWSFGTRGDILVARSPVRRVVPALLPETVKEALAGNRVSRLGAVHLLRQGLRHRDAAEALAARDALASLTEDDSRSVSHAAELALAEVAVSAVPPSLEFTDLEVGTPSPSRTVTLAGSALAEIAQAESAPEWADVRRTGDGFAVTVTCAATGEVTGTIRFATPVGTVEVPVTAWAGPVTTQRSARPTPVPPRPVPSAAGKPPPVERTSAVAPAPIRAAWLVAAACLVLVLAVPANPDDLRLATVGFAVLALGGAAALLAVEALRDRPSPSWWALAGTGAAVLLADTVAVLLAVAARRGGHAGAALPLAVLAAVLATGTTVAFWIVRRHPPDPGPVPVTVPVPARGMWAAAGALLLVSTSGVSQSYFEALVDWSDSTPDAVFAAVSVLAAVVLLVAAAGAGGPTSMLWLALPGTVVAVHFAVWGMLEQFVQGNWLVLELAGAVLAVTGTVLAWRSSGLAWRSSGHAVTPQDPPPWAATTWAVAAVFLIAWLVHYPSFPIGSLVDTDGAPGWIYLEWTRGPLPAVLLLVSALSLRRGLLHRVWPLAVAGTVLAVYSLLPAACFEVMDDPAVGPGLVLGGAVLATVGTVAAWRGRDRALPKGAP
jgi:hypothetical protein